MVELEVTKRWPECVVCHHPWAAHVDDEDDPECLACTELETWAIHRYVEGEWAWLTS